MTENTTETTAYNGSGLKGPLYWLAGVVTGKLALNALQGGGLFGTSNTATTAANMAVQYELTKKDAEIVQLKAAQETDQKMLQLYTELRTQDKAQDASVSAIDKRLSAIETAAPLREQLVMAKIDEVSTLATNGIAANSTAIQNLATVVSSVTKTVIPNSNVCPGWGNVTITPQGPFTVPGGVNPPTPA